MFAENLTQLDYTQLFSLKNKVALITGAAGHLGAYMAFCLGQAGAQVLINGRNKDKLSALQQRLNQHNIESTILDFDLTDLNAINENVHYITTHYGYLDILVNNAHQGRACDFAQANREDFFRDYDIDVVASFELIKSTKELLKKAVSKRGDASVINIASMYGWVSPDPRIYSNSKMNNPPHYGAAKAALIQLTKYMACHLAEHKIRVNAISPGPFPLEEVINQHPDFKQKLESKVPLARIGHPSELQGPLLFLASRASSFVTGINLPVDGGWTAW